MAQLQELILTDRATTPVNHSFMPGYVDKNGVAIVTETTGVPLGESKVTVSLRRTGTRIKGRLVLTVPVVQTETINGISNPKVVRSAILSADITFDNGSTEQERNNAIGMFASAFGTSKVMIHDAFVKLNNIH